MTLPASGFDPRSPDFRANPYPYYDLLRQAAPVFFWPAWGIWFLSRYDDCNALLRDPRVGHGAMAFTAPAEQQPLFDMQAHWMLLKNPPDHTRLRGLVHKAFTPRIVEQMRGRIQAITDRLLDAVQGDGQADLVAALAYPLPVTVIAELLGIPREDRAKFREWSQAIIMGGSTGADMEKVGGAALEFIMYFHEKFDERRAAPKDDLITALVQAEEAGDKLDPQELISMVFLLLVAGHETTVNLLGNGTLALLQHPDQKQLLRDNPDLVRSAVEELLRYDGPVGVSTMRWALEDVEYYGQVIPAGQMVVASLLAANRDPAAFESPNRLDITRTPNKHIAFGNGIHYCVGAPLARLEGAVAFNTLLRRLPNLALAVDVGQLAWNPTILLHGPGSGGKPA